MSAIISTQKLRPIRDLSSPSLPAAETCGSRRLPEHRSKSTRHGAHEEPLTSAEVARSRHQSYLLQKLPHRYAKPRVVGVRHVCANDAARDFSLTRVAPRDTPRTNVGAEFDEAPSRKVIQIELQAVFQAGSVLRTRNWCTRLTFVGAILPR